MQRNEVKRMKVELSPGETLLVTYEGTDGEVQVTFANAATEVRVDGRIVHVDPFAVDGDGNVLPECCEYHRTGGDMRQSCGGDRSAFTRECCEYHRTGGDMRQSCGGSVFTREERERLHAGNVEDTFMPDEAMDEEPAFPNGACLARREQDEWACAMCGLRWGVDETRPEAAQCAARSKQ